MIGLVYRTLLVAVSPYRTHQEVPCHDHTQLLYHLGGRYYLATAKASLNLSNGTLNLMPLTVYHIPCNETNPLLLTGFGECPSAIKMSLPIFQNSTISDVSWVPSKDQQTLRLHYESLKFVPLMRSIKHSCALTGNYI